MKIASLLVTTALLSTVMSLSSFAKPAKTEGVDATIYALTETGLGAPVGTLHVQDSKSGLTLTPHLSGLPVGMHGIHVHQNPDCSAKEKDGAVVPGLAAGGHFDPDKSGKHLGPHGGGHRGDLPFLLVDKDGTAKKILRAPHLTLADVRGHAIVIHEGGDNYSDDPKPLGGGGKRIACGVVQ